MELPLYKSGCEFSTFSQKGGVQIFPMKRERLLNWGVGEGVVLKKGVSLIFILTNSFQYYLLECLVCVYVFCLFTPFPSVVFVFHGKNLLLFNLISRYIYDFYK